MALKPVSTYETTPEEHTYALDGSGRRVCGARTREGGICQGHPMAGPGTRCKRHGGKASKKVGIAHHRFKHGRHSKYIKGALSTLYEETRNDENWLSLQDEVHLVDALILDALEDENPSVKRLSGLIEMRRKLAETERKRIEAAQGMMPVDKVRGIVRLMVDIIREHVRDERVLVAIQRDIDRLL